MIKIDVDGIEHLILLGATKTLRMDACKTVLIEINKSFEEQAQKINKILTDCGFILDQTRQSELVGRGKFSNVSNQIWVKR